VSPGSSDIEDSTSRFDPPSRTVRLAFVRYRRVPLAVGGDDEDDPPRVRRGVDDDVGRVDWDSPTLVVAAWVPMAIGAALGDVLPGT